MIEVKDLSKSYGSRNAISNVSFNIERGRVYGLLGPNGAGKSTTMNIMTGCLESSGGKVTVDGFDIYEKAADAKRKIGYLPEIPPLYPDMTPFEFLRFVAKAKKFKGDADAEARRVAALCGVTDVGDRLIKYLSKGYCQRVGIASALIGDPEYVILDEPTVGLDPKQIIEIRSLINELGREHGVILSSHILQEITAVCDYIIIIACGEVVASGTAKELEGDSASRVTVEAHCGASALEEALSSVEGANIVSCEDDGEYSRAVLECETGFDPREDIFRAASERGIVLRELSLSGESLEELFIRLTEDAANRRAEKEALEKEGKVAEIPVGVTSVEDSSYSPLFGEEEAGEDESESDEKEDSPSDSAETDDEEKEDEGGKGK
ncbi:MAG: ABC transporter ATP-binding protein [Clostridia bacterium]|nr:ABC transporter ATP-binding protein [Clostridia bacterium]